MADMMYTKGVKQGCPLSPLLFGIYFDRVTAFVEQQLQGNACKSGIIKVLSMQLTMLLFADDVVILATSVDALRDIV